MKSVFLCVTLSLGLVTPLLADNTNVLTDEKAKASYAIGMMLGHNWKQQSIDVDPDLVLRGLKDAQSGGATLLTPEEMQSTLREYQQTIAAKQRKAREELAEKNKAEGEAFLATNKDNPGVMTLPVTLPNGKVSDLEYMVITNGTGKMPETGDTVTVNYRGTLLDGTEFDSSYKRGQPAKFPVTGVIRGWTEALQKMKVGSKWKVFIPADLAYGEMGNRSIPPNSTLIFEVELLDTEPTPATSAPPAAQPLTSDIIKVPSAAEMKKGAKIETLKAEDVQKMQSNSTAK
jgi:FKBP-type peptidyl-prolyl cis-trans isomerase FklB